MEQKRQPWPDEHVAHGLRWDGRWGVWHRDRGDCVYVFAPCVAEFTVSKVGDSEDMSGLLTEVHSSLQRELSADSVVAVVMPRLNAFGTQMGLRALLVCRSSECRQLSNAWQGRAFCNGRLSISWASTVDTVASEFVGKSRQAWNRWAESAVELPRALALELPARWALKNFPAEGFPTGSGAPLGVGTHWRQFVDLFGKVTQAELAWSSGNADAFCDFAIASLLVEFASAASAQVMFELLHNRYLHNPLKHDDFHAVLMSCGGYDELRRKAIAFSMSPLPARAHPSGPTGPAYRIWRCDSGAAKEPVECLVTAQKPTVSLGRQGPGIDVGIPFHYISRLHAKLTLLPEVAGRTPTILYIEDKSTNGTWVNEIRLETGQQVRVGEDDKISFRGEGDYPEYALQYIANVELHNGVQTGKKQRVA